MRVTSICRKTAILSIVLIMISSLLSGQVNTKNGWAKLLKNDNTCISDFEKAKKAKEPNADVHMMMAKIYTSNTGHQYKQLYDFYKSQPNDVEAYLYALWSSNACNMWQSIKWDENAVNLANDILKDAKISGALKAVSAQALGLYYFNQKKWDKASEYFAMYNPISTWQITGPFDNVQGSGFYKNHGVIEKPNADAVFVNKNGANIAWHTLANTKSSGWIDFDYIAGQTSNVLYYGQTFITSPTKRDVLITAGVSGSVKVWVNDALIISKADELNTDLDMYGQKITLNAGPNRIVVQTGSSKIYNNNFLVRFTDDKYNTLKDLTASATAVPYTKSTVNTNPIISLPFETIFKDKIAKDSTDYLSYLMLAFVYDHNNQKNEQKSTLDKIYNKYPKSSITGLLKMDVEGYLQNEEIESKVRNSILDNDPESIISLLIKFQEAIKQENYTEAETINKKLDKLEDPNVEQISRGMQLASFNKDMKGITDYINEGYDKYTNEYYFNYLKYLLLKDLGNVDQGYAIIEKYNKNHISDEATSLLYESYVERNKKKDAINLYEQLVENMPYASGYLSKLSSAYFNAQDYQKALDVKFKEIKNFPFSGGDWKTVGEIYEQMNKKKEAIEAYNKAIYYSPNDYDTRRKIRKIDGKKDVYSYFAPMDIPEKIRKSTPKDSFPGDALHIVNYEVQRVIYPEGGDEEKMNLVIQVLNDEGIDAVKEYSVGAVDNNQYAEIEKAEIIKLNGSKIDGDISGTNIVFTGLEVGDWVSITYKYINYRSGKLLEHFWGKFYFDYFYPTQNAKYQLLVPKTKKFDYTVTNDGIKPTIKEADEFNLYTWEKKNAPKIKSENLMPVSGDFSDVLHLSSIPDWKFVAEWYRDLANQSDFIDPTVTQAVKEALKDVPNGTNDQKVKAIYEYIINNISYSQVPFRQGPYIPQEPAKVLDSRLGDCKDVSSLFVKMTKEAGINSQLVLVNTRDNGRKTMLLPSIDFNHCIAKTTYQNKDAFLELTSKHIAFLTTPYTLDEAQILPIPSKGEAAQSNLSVTNLKQSIIQNQALSKTNVVIKGNQLEVEKKSKYTANFASNYRSGYRNISKEEIEKGILEQTTSIYSGSVKLQSFQFENLDNLKDTVMLTKKFTVANAVNKVGSLNIIPLNWSDKEPNLNFLAEDTRSYLLDYKIRNLTDYDEEEITISTSKGEKFIEIPENATFTFDNQITYTYTYKLENNVMKAKRTVKVTSFDIQPERYAAFKEFFGKIVEEDNKQIGFK